jgi:hypothetical protein
MIDWSKVKWPEEYPKPVLVVPDRLVEMFREAFPYARVIPISETRLPSGE